MTDSSHQDHAPCAADYWARPFFRRMLASELPVEEFEAAVDARWQDREFVIRAPATTAWLHEVATSGQWREAGYAHAAPELGFRSHYLVGTAGRPGAVYIEAPPESSGAVGLHSLNRPLHQHDSGRMAIITTGVAIFHVLASFGDDTVMLDCAVKAGDIVFWPAWTPHTFDARDGFSLITAMANYVSPAADGFVFSVDEDLLSTPRKAYAEYRTA